MTAKSSEHADDHAQKPVTTLTAVPDSRQVTHDDFKAWLRRHGHEPKRMAREPVFVRFGDSDDLAYLDFGQFVADSNGEPQLVRGEPAMLVERVLLPFDIIAGEGAP